MLWELFACLLTCSVSFAVISARTASLCPYASIWQANGKLGIGLDIRKGTGGVEGIEIVDGNVDN